ncbi:MAG: 4Fe-4S binding protein [Elusimicrobia bacterium]|nr:4Fe-4S binding protein [Elusimicrobiota bacterium]
MRRKIIKIDEEKCNGCGLCTNACPEGAIKIIDGKAKLVGDLLCDGLGACIGNCPEDAITIEEREAEKYNEKKVMENIVKGGRNLIKAHFKHLQEHSQTEYLNEAIKILKKKNIEIPELNNESLSYKCGCPGSKVMDLRGHKKEKSLADDVSVKSELSNWPVQLHLINPSAPYFDNADIIIAADCIPFCYGNFHGRFLKNKVLIIFCPKLDDAQDLYVKKLAEIFQNKINSITVIHLEVPCCFGTVKIVEESLKKSGKNISIKDYTISIKGEIV